MQAATERLSLCCLQTPGLLSAEMDLAAVPQLLSTCPAQSKNANSKWMIVFVLVADFRIAASRNGPCCGGSISAQLPWPEQADHWRTSRGV